MFLRLSYLYISLSIVSCQPDYLVPPQPIQEAPKTTITKEYEYRHAVDVDGPYSKHLIDCLNKTGYDLVFFRAYAPFNGGEVDHEGLDAMKWADEKLSIEAYATPLPKNGKSAKQQMDEIDNAFRNTYNRTLHVIWLQVMAPEHWSNNTKENVNFIEEFIKETETKEVPGDEDFPNHVLVGIYTSPNDWKEITGNWEGANNSNLWYSQVRGAGLRGESVADFRDFDNFGGWSNDAWVLAKQFSQLVNVCGVILNRVIYRISEPNESKKRMEIEQPMGRRIKLGRGVVKK